MPVFDSSGNQKFVSLCQEISQHAMRLTSRDGKKDPACPVKTVTCDRAQD